MRIRNPRNPQNLNLRAHLVRTSLRKSPQHQHQVRKQAAVATLQIRSRIKGPQVDHQSPQNQSPRPPLPQIRRRKGKPPAK